MSNLREKAREVKEAGEAKRGEFQPTGVPLAFYDYWLRQSNSKRAKAIRRGSRTENFCHFWRVVAIWAPLRALLNSAEKALPFVIGLAALGALVAFIAALFVVENFWLGTLATIGLGIAGVVGLLGFMSGIALAVDPDSRRIYDLPQGKFMVTFAILGAPLSIPMYLISKAIQGIMWAFNNHERKTVAVVLGSVTTGTFGIIGAAGGLSAMVITLAIILGIAVAGTAVISTGVWLSTYIEGKRELDKQKYIEFREAYFEANGTEFVAPARKPSKTKAFFRGLGDFIILIGQVVRVNKWKICPTVEIKTGSTY